jgi:hypothetical protein
MTAALPRGAGAAAACAPLLPDTFAAATHALARACGLESRGRSGATGATADATVFLALRLLSMCVGANGGLNLPRERLLAEPGLAAKNMAALVAALAPPRRGCVQGDTLVVSVVLGTFAELSKRGGADADLLIAAGAAAATRRALDALRAGLPRSGQACLSNFVAQEAEILCFLAAPAGDAGVGSSSINSSASGGGGSGGGCNGGSCGGGGVEPGGQRQQASQAQLEALEHLLSLVLACPRERSTLDLCTAMGAANRVLVARPALRQPAAERAGFLAALTDAALFDAAPGCPAYAAYYKALCLSQGEEASEDPSAPATSACDAVGILGLLADGRPHSPSVVQSVNFRVVDDIAHQRGGGAGGGGGERLGYGRGVALMLAKIGRGSGAAHGGAAATPAVVREVSAAAQALGSHGQRARQAGSPGGGSGAPAAPAPVAAALTAAADGAGGRVACAACGRTQQQSASGKLSKCSQCKQVRTHSLESGGTGSNPGLTSRSVPTYQTALRCVQLRLCVLSNKAPSCALCREFINCSRRPLQVSYCSKQCQKDHWRAGHKAACCRA